MPDCLLRALNGEARSENPLAGKSFLQNLKKVAIRDAKLAVGSELTKGIFFHPSLRR